jgi:outer membrane protein assembly factor BamA
MDTDKRLRRALIAFVTGVALVVARSAGAGTSVIPIPEIITDPNEGNTFGLLGVVLFTDEKDEIQYMLAPDIRYNATKGVFPIVRFFGYPTPTRRYSLLAGKSTTKDEDYEFEFADRGLWDGRAFVLADGVYEADSTDRFFGFGNFSNEIRESNYTGQNLLVRLTPGVWLLPHFHLSFRTRIHRFEISDGQVHNLPFIGAEFRKEVRDGHGLDTGLYWANRLAFTYDTRDSIDIPSRGAYAVAYGEVADRRLGSSSSFVKFGLEARDFIPLRKGDPKIKPTLALRALADYTNGPNKTPFWEMNSLGGRRALRGFGSDRFINFNRSLVAAEVRTRVWQRHLFGVNVELELAPFVEAGKVFEHTTQSPVSGMHGVYGLGFRGVVRPQIVGFVDIGRGTEGTSIFTGVDYPF